MKSKSLVRITGLFEITFSFSFYPPLVSLTVKYFVLRLCFVLKSIIATTIHKNTTNKNTKVIKRNIEAYFKYVSQKRSHLNIHLAIRYSKITPTSDNPPTFRPKIKEERQSSLNFIAASFISFFLCLCFGNYDRNIHLHFRYVHQIHSVP